MRAINQKALAVVSCLCAGTGSVTAEPSPSVTLLMREPTSLFDFGIHKLREKAKARLEWYNVKKEGFSDGFGTADVKYKYKDNVIEISISSLSDTSTDVTQSRCRKFRQSFISALLNYPATLFPIKQRVEFLVEEIFSHEGYTNNNLDPTFYETISNIVYVEADLIGKDSKYISCRAKISEEEPSYKNVPTIPIN